MLADDEPAGLIGADFSAGGCRAAAKRPIVMQTHAPPEYSPPLPTLRTQTSCTVRLPYSRPSKSCTVLSTIPERVYPTLTTIRPRTWPARMVPAPVPIRPTGLFRGWSWLQFLPRFEVGFQGFQASWRRPMRTHDGIDAEKATPRAK